MMGQFGVSLLTLGAMVGHMSPAMARYYTHISGPAQRQAVEMLDKYTDQMRFVDTFVDTEEISESRAFKLLN